MASKYNFTKEFLQAEYDRLGNFKAIASAQNIPRTTIERWCKKLGVVTTPKLQYELNHNFFAQETEEVFYWAGFIAADGCILTHKSKVPNVLQLVISQKDQVHLENFRDAIHFSGEIRHIISKLSKQNSAWKDSNQVRLDIYSKSIISDLIKFGIGQRKSFTYQFPDWLISHPMKNHFMRGFNDGDGSFYSIKETRQTKNNGARTYSKMCVSLRGPETFLKTYQDIIQTEICFVSKTTPKYNNGIHQLRFSGTSMVSKICKFLYANASVFMKRKYEIIKDLL